MASIQSASDGSRALPGCVRLGIIYKLSGLSAHEFGDHWRGPHGVHASRMPGLRRYHQNHVLETLVTGGTDRWKVSGLSELWFDDVDAMDSAIASKEYGAVASDTPNVMTVPGIIAGVQLTLPGLPHVDRPLPKIMMLLGRRPDRDAQSFRDELEQLLPGFVSLEGIAAGRCTVITKREGDPGVEVGYEAIPIDAVLESWFETTESAHKVFSTPSMGLPGRLAEIAPDLAAYIVDAHVVVP